jgi:hypothetical protein
MKIIPIALAWSAVLALAVLMLGCVTTAPAPTVPVDYPALCQHLAAIGCGEGAEPNCARGLERVQTARLTNLRPTCLLDASDRAQARACGSVECP